MSRANLDSSPFLRACRGLAADHVPIWIMRQAGRYLPEYRALKEQYDFRTMSRTPDLMAQVTLQPLHRFPMDAAILFADIMTPLPSLGFEIDFSPGPVVANPVRTAEDVAGLDSPQAEEIAPFVEEAIALVASELSPSQALIGFAGAPFTLMCYLVEGGGSKDFMTARSFLHNEPEAATALLEKLAENQLQYLRRQAAAGADALMLFDSWVGLLAREDYVRFALPVVERIAAGMQETGLPLIYFPFGGGHLLEEVKRLPVQVVGIDWRVPLSNARGILGPDIAVQGNLDPAALFQEPGALVESARSVLEEAGSQPGHVFNLGHGIDRRTSPDQVARLVDYVHEWRAPR